MTTGEAIVGLVLLGVGFYGLSRLADRVQQVDRRVALLEGQGEAQGSQIGQLRGDMRQGYTTLEGRLSSTEQRVSRLETTPTHPLVLAGPGNGNGWYPDN